MLNNLLSLTDEQKRLVAWGRFLDHVLDDQAKELINRVGIEYVVKSLGYRYNTSVVCITPIG